MAKCLAALTAINYEPPYPPFINVSEDGDKVTVMIRSEADRSGEYPTTGSSGTITMTRDEFKKFLSELREFE